MSGFGKRKRRATSFYQIIFSCAIILSLGMMGIGYAFWSDHLSFEGTVSTGSLKPVFLDSSLDNRGCQGSGQAIISRDGERLSVNIKNAYHGDLYFLDFKIKNEGTLPLQVEIETDTDEFLELKFLRNPKEFLDSQETSEWQMRIKVHDPKGKGEREGTSRFIVQLSFRQKVVL